MRKLVAVLALTLTGCAADTSDLGTQRNALSLAGSEFEIDNDANLVLDGTGTLDWALVEEYRQLDTESGQNDNSYAKGAKESSICPSVETGSIPNNKSDLLSFGAWVEVGSPGFLHLYWSRVQEPVGTTLMDFEINQSNEDCGNGVNPIRTVGDLLIEYSLDNGGSVATITVREWDGSDWGPATDLTALGLATGTINDSPITEEDSDGLGAMSARTFGEASINLSFLFDPSSCTSFGSVLLKSRSSSTFNSALKDFVAPRPVNLSNCGNVTIRKQTVPGGQPESFTFNHNLQTDPAGGTAFSLEDGQSKALSNVLFGTGYQVTEQAADGYELLGIDCSSSVGVVPTVDVGSASVSFDLGVVGQSVDCTFTNRRNLGSIKITKLREHAASGDGLHPHSGVHFAVTGGSLTESLDAVTGEDGTVCVGSLEFGDYVVTEIVPDGYKASDVSQNVSITEVSSCPGGPEITFTNYPLTNIMCVIDSQVDGGVSSSIVCDGLSPIMSNADGDATLNLQDVLPGVYNCTLTVD